MILNIFHPTLRLAQNPKISILSHSELQYTHPVRFGILHELITHNKESLSSPNIRLVGVCSSFSQRLGLDKRIHWEKTNNIDKAMEYCCKEDTRNGVVIKFGFPKEIKIIEVLKPWQKIPLPP